MNVLQTTGRTVPVSYCETPVSTATYVNGRDKNTELVERTGWKRSTISKKRLLINIIFDKPYKITT